MPKLDQRNSRSELLLKIQISQTANWLGFELTTSLLSNNVLGSELLKANFDSRYVYRVYKFYEIFEKVYEFDKMGLATKLYTL